MTFKYMTIGHHTYGYDSHRDNLIKNNIHTTSNISNVENNITNVDFHD